jgi:hypothetical protein
MISAWRWINSIPRWNWKNWKSWSCWKNWSWYCILPMTKRKTKTKKTTKMRKKTRRRYCCPDKR